LVGELLHEIMETAAIHAFYFDLAKTLARLEDFLQAEKYFVFVARKSEGKAIGFVNLFESFALYADGAFGTIAELYVCSEYRSQQIGR